VVRKADAKERKAREKSSSSSSSSEAEETGGRVNGAMGRGAKKVERALTPAEQRTKASARVLAELAADSVAAQVATVENPQKLGQMKEASVLAAALVADLGQGSFGPKADTKVSVGSLADAFESAERPSAKGTAGQPTVEAGALSLAERQARAAVLQGEIAKTKADIASVVSATVTKPGGGLARGAASSGGTSSREVGRATPPAVRAGPDPAAKAARSGMASTGDSAGGGSSAEPTLVAPARQETPEERAKRKAAEAAKLTAKSAAAAALAAAAKEGRPLTASEAAAIRALETPEERAKRKAAEALAAGGRRQETQEERAKRKAAEAARAARKAQEAEKAKLADAGIVAKNGSSSSSGAPKKELTTIYVDSGSSVSAFNLYDGLPMPDPVKDEDCKKKASITDRPKLEYTPDKTKVLFLDIDGVVRPLMGCFQMSSIVMDGENVPIVEGSSEFLPSSLAALRTILEATGCIMVMSSEWRRHDSLRDGVNRNLRMNGLPMCVDNTPQQERDMTGNPLRSFAIRRAREIGEWLRSHPEVKQWVALDDIDLGMADEERIFGQPFLTQRLVLTDKVACLTARDAKKACDILEGKLNKPRDLAVSSDT